VDSLLNRRNPACSGDRGVRLYLEQASVKIRLSTTFREVQSVRRAANTPDIMQLFELYPLKCNFIAVCQKIIEFEGKCRPFAALSCLLACFELARGHTTHVRSLYWATLAHGINLYEGSLNCPGPCYFAFVFLTINSFIKLFVS
jgi:hypothetical protein